MKSRQGVGGEPKVLPKAESSPPPAVHRQSVANGAVKPVAILGLYSSGSTATSGILYHLGAKMEKELWGNYYEPKWLSEELRRWWDEPRLRERVKSAKRIQVLTRWLKDLSADKPEFVAAKHPLLTLCGSDLVSAWGPDTKFIWTYRPLDESIASLARRGWFPDHHVKLQKTLWAAANAFFADREHLRIEFADLLASPETQIDRIIDFLGVDVAGQRRQQAIASILRDK